MDIKTVGVVGCGLMGSGIAETCARKGYRTIVREVNDDLLAKGMKAILKAPLAPEELEGLRKAAAAVKELVGLIQAKA